MKSSTRESSLSNIYVKVPAEELIELRRNNELLHEIANHVSRIDSFSRYRHNRNKRSLERDN